MSRGYFHLALGLRLAALVAFVAVPFATTSDGASRSGWYLLVSAHGAGGAFAVASKAFCCLALSMLMFSSALGFHQRRVGIYEYRPFTGEATLDQWQGVLGLGAVFLFLRVVGVLGDGTVDAVPAPGLYGFAFCLLALVILGTRERRFRPGESEPG